MIVYTYNIKCKSKSHKYSCTYQERCGVVWTEKKHVNSATYNKKKKNRKDTFYGSVEIWVQLVLKNEKNMLVSALHDI